ncbi:PREDICTED: uncharacterized protein LOC104738352 [Camelina sativa]|uniref:Uncharacterized protein LOC104738352 n=1 Tax=Camelina sativa TaxID=90675 RepID=A0ABM0VIS7_CAMSA|nr:PREDICTED: uncharacterized protein LOC104738352 [Camelina sativa]
MINGDFNDILYPAETSNANIVCSTRGIRMFGDCLADLGLFDLPFSGPQFTWTNKRSIDLTGKKLDRCLVNGRWLSMFPFSHCTFETPEFSDHSPCFIQLVTTPPSYAWVKVGVPMSTLKDFCFKLKKLKGPMKFLMRFNFSDLVKRVVEAHSKLNALQLIALNDPYTVNLQNELLAKDVWMHLSLAEECFFKQKSRLTWLGEGDFNTSFFHKTIKGRFCPHLLVFLESLLQSTCLNAQQSSLSSPFSNEAIKTCLFKMPLNKTPGPDGLPAEFFKSSWYIIGQDLTMGVQQFFLDSFIPSALKSTSLILIPKIPGTLDVRDFRPISCLKMAYKIISRLLLDRLKIHLPDLILPNQTAYITDRLLLENVLLASEVMQGYQLASGKERITLKVDISKAFDSVRWDFLLSSLHAYKVPQGFINWIRACACFPSFSISINGVYSGFFKGRTCLRQGDPLFPIQFVMIMNVLSLMLNKAAEEGSFNYHPGCEDLKLTHLCFADDLLIFLEGSEHSLRGVMSVLSEFEEMSRLGMNIEKTSMFCSGLSESSLERLHLLCNLKHVSLPVRDGSLWVAWIRRSDGPSLLGIPLLSTVAELRIEDGWSLPTARLERQFLLHSFIYTITMSTSNDTPVWAVDGITHRYYSSKVVWYAVRISKSVKSWAPLVWHKVAIPRHAITTWLFILNRNPTLDRLSTWGYDVELDCLLCGLGHES